MGDDTHTPNNFLSTIPYEKEDYKLAIGDLYVFQRKEKNNVPLFFYFLQSHDLFVWRTLTNRNIMESKQG